MKTDQITNLLANLTEGLRAQSDKEKKAIEDLQKSLAKVLLTQEPDQDSFQALKGQRSLFSTIKADKSKLNELVTKLKPQSTEDELQVQMLKSSLQDLVFDQDQAKGTLQSIVDPFAGARVHKTDGPFYTIDDFDIRFRFYKTKKLNALYIQGQALPAILFNTITTGRIPLDILSTEEATPLQKEAVKASGRLKVSDILRKASNKIEVAIDVKKTTLERQVVLPSGGIKNPIAVKPQPVPQEPPVKGITYEIAGDTIWINAKLLCDSAPEGQYCGLRIKNGTIALSETPSTVSKKLTAKITTTITVNLNLEQKQAETQIDNTEAYGIDAREGTYKLPLTFSFSIKNKTRNIRSIGDASVKLYQQPYTLSYKNDQHIEYNPIIGSITIPMESSKNTLSVQKAQSPLIDIQGEAPIKKSYWTLYTTPINIEKPLEADSNGGFLFQGGAGLSSNLKNTEEKFTLQEPIVFLQPGYILILDLKSSGIGQYRKVALWKDASKPFGTTAEIKYLKESLFYYGSASLGEESLITMADLNLNIDRPVKVNGQPVSIQTKKSIVAFAGSKIGRRIRIIDPNIIEDNTQPTSPLIPAPPIKPIAFALQNALLTVTPANILSLQGEYDEAFLSISNASLTTIFGILSYIPTLPDPYAANLGELKNQRWKRDSNLSSIQRQIQLWLVNTTTWNKDEEVNTSFSFSSSGNIPSEKQIALTSSPERTNPEPNTLNFSSLLNQQKDLSSLKISDQADLHLTNRATNKNKFSEYLNLFLGLKRPGHFELLDLSSNANQMGVAFSGSSNNPEYRLVGNTNPEAWAFPFQIQGLDVVSQGLNAKAFTLPQISWEPVFNFTKPEPKAPGSKIKANDPPLGFNYYPNDGVPTYIGNQSPLPVALSPIPMAQYLEKVYQDKNDKITYALFNLPFGMFGFSVLNHSSGQSLSPNLANIRPTFNGEIEGGIQLELTAGKSFAAEDNLFQGFTIQTLNVQDLLGNQNDYSTLGSSVSEIFNNEFGKESPGDASRPGVPLTRIGLSGYGASSFSDWANKNATYSATSQATFNVATGRTAHEVVQVKSVIYPWGIFVVRTITIFRLNNGYIARMDSGWQAESEGKFYFEINNKPNPYEIHAGLINGLYNIRNIRENELEYSESGGNVTLRGLTFDADVEIEGVIEGQDAQKWVPTKGALGFVQLAPRGTALNPQQFASLLRSQNNSIGAPVNCTIKIAGTEQYMKINRVDLNNAVDKNDKAIFAAAARGSVSLPKEGSWTMVSHQVNDGTVTPLPTDMSVPLIRMGKWDRGKLEKISDLDNLWRIANPAELIKPLGADSVNFGFLQNLNTQKILYLNPTFKKGINSLLSKTPPLLADAYRLLNTQGIFPNIGNADTNLGDAIQLLKGGTGSVDLLKALPGITDGAKQVFEILEIQSRKEAKKLLDQGYKLLKKAGDDILNNALSFDLPTADYDLVDTKGFKVRIAYVAGKNNLPGKSDYSIDSFSTALADQWKGRLNNLSMIVSLGPFDDLMTISGNFNNEKGKESNFGGTESGGAGILPTPEIKFSKAIEPVLQILELLSQLSTGNYKEAFQKGLQVAMSNNANIWEYKYEASKDIPLVRFPPGPAYDAPQVPLKLEACMSLGVYFNAALKVTNDPKQLIPSAGAFFNFHGGLQVMCMSIGAGSIYAVGNVDLKLAADTSPLIALTMKFGFGAQIGVGLPVIGTVSILFMIGIEIYVDSSQKVIVTAIMLFRGHAEILGGLVGVTITIEAKGSIEKANADAPTNCRAAVSFGLDISVFLIIDISFHESWEETKQIA